ncbi:Tigger transposable element-derived protein 4 [Araneus ventricosus]|uniref:Tigger transposable element-derived protein 4 n=1 Tax=Araneus ventricosus TaxID=182803 RepID=A0A4Y2MNF4_ARAVE|nr:Tigger transposable element-derived protein 4 [Araneus ventricosus]
MDGENRKLDVLSVEDKIKPLKFLDEKLKDKVEIAAYFKIPSRTLSTIIKNREIIEKSYDAGNRKKIKIRNSTYPEVEECARKWFVECRDQDLPVSGLMLQHKSEDFAKELDSNSEFKASNGWLENSTKRHNIVLRKLCSQSASVDASSCEEWLSGLPSLLKDYKAGDVFNADETGLFLQSLPNKTAAFKSEEFYGGKQSYDRTIQKAEKLS